MSPWNECLANVPKACESVCCICVRGSFLFQWNCVQLRHGNLSTTTYRNRSSLRGTPKPFPTCPPVSIPKGGGGGGPPPPSNQFPFNWNQFHGGGGHIDSINLFGGGGGGWRALSFDKSILSRGQINFQPTPIFVNKNSSFALPELAFVKFLKSSKPQPFVTGGTIKLLTFPGISSPPPQWASPLFCFRQKRRASQKARCCKHRAFEDVLYRSFFARHSNIFKHLLRRYLSLQQHSKTPSKEVFGWLGLLGNVMQYK